MKAYIFGGMALIIAALVIFASVLWIKVSYQAEEISSLTKTVAQQKKDAEALNSSLKSRDEALAEAQAKSQTVKTVIAPMRNTEADPDISPIMRKYFEERSK